MRRFHGTQNVYWITLCLVLSWLTGCSESVPDETRLRQAISAMEQAAEAKQTRVILDYLSEDFLGNKVYRKANIRGMLLLHFHQNQHIHVYLRIVDLVVKDGLAFLTCQVILAGQDEKIVPERGRILVIDSDWEKRDGEWRVVRAHWKDPFLQPG